MEKLIIVLAIVLFGVTFFVNILPWFPAVMNDLNGGYLLTYNKSQSRFLVEIILLILFLCSAFLLDREGFNWAFLVGVYVFLQLAISPLLFGGSFLGISYKMTSLYSLVILPPSVLCLVIFNRLFLSDSFKSLVRKNGVSFLLSLVFFLALGLIT